LARWIVGVVGFVLSPVLGFVTGVAVAFGYTYVFLDTDRTGNADIGTNMSFFGIAVFLGIIGIVTGLIGGIRILAWTFNTKMDGSISGVAFREVDR
jgi:hypothetical protein